MELPPPTFCCCEEIADIFEGIEGVEVEESCLESTQCDAPWAGMFGHWFAADGFDQALHGALGYFVHWFNPSRVVVIDLGG